MRTLALVALCGVNAAPGVGVPSEQSVPNDPASLGYVSKYEILATLPHDPKSFTQGLIFDDGGTLYESLGLYGYSGVKSIDMKTGGSLSYTPMSRSDFGEGVAIVDGNKLLQLTWKERKVLEYSLPTLQKIQEVPISIGREGWGLASDGSKLYLTDSTDTLFHVDAHTYKVTQQMKIVDKRLGGMGKVIQGVNELEWVNGELWGNVYPLYQATYVDATHHPYSIMHPYSFGSHCMSILGLAAWPLLLAWPLLFVGCWVSCAYHYACHSRPQGKHSECIVRINPETAEVCHY